eukprot:augustus_masked-scaffold_48-processed-gene-0.49-mRNA-1 protein AED:1.00 eAED:1.00 QI:0/-1/0/0/-1/1/1/0/729
MQNRFRQIQSFKLGNSRERTRSVRKKNARRVTGRSEAGSFSSSAQSRTAKLSFRTATSMKSMHKNTLKKPRSMLAITIPDEDLSHELAQKEQGKLFAKLISTEELIEIELLLNDKPNEGTVKEAAHSFKEFKERIQMSEESTDGEVDFTYICVPSSASYSELITGIKGLFPDEEKRFFWIDQFCYKNESKRHFGDFLRSGLCKRCVLFTNTPLIFQPKAGINTEFVAKLAKVHYDEAFVNSARRFMDATRFLSMRKPPVIAITYPNFQNGFHTQAFLEILLTNSDPVKFLRTLCIHLTGSIESIDQSIRTEINLALVSLVEKLLDEEWNKEKLKAKRVAKVSECKVALAKIYRKQLSIPTFALGHLSEVYDEMSQDKNIKNVDKLTKLLNLAGTYYECGIYVASEQIYEEMMVVLDKVFSTNKNNVTVVKQLLYIGHCLVQRTALEEAKNKFHEALEICDIIEEKEPKTPLNGLRAECYLGLGNAAYEDYDAEESQNYLLQAEELFEEEKEKQVALNSSYVETKLALARLCEREREEEQCLEILKDLGPVGATHLLSAQIQFETSGTEEKLQSYCRAILRKDPYLRKIRSRKIFHLMAQYYLKKANKSQCAHFLEPLLALHESQVTVSERIEWLNDFSRLLVLSSRPSAGLQKLEQQLKLIEQARGGESAKYALCLWNQAVILYNMKKVEYSKAKWERALAIFKRNLDEYTNEQVMRCAVWFDKVTHTV